MEEMPNVPGAEGVELMLQYLISGRPRPGQSADL
jgi:hypothetical protein